MALLTGCSTSAGETGGWRPCDEVVELDFEMRGGAPIPSYLAWRGSLWRVVGSSRHWSTWQALPIRVSVHDRRPSIAAQSVDFWRFAAQTNPVSPLLHFEVRRSSREWRLVRLGASVGIPEPSLQQQPFSSG